jgi:hypothetical protein
MTTEVNPERVPKIFLQQLVRVELYDPTANMAAGRDQFGQFNVCKVEGDSLTSWIKKDPRGLTCGLCGKKWGDNITEIMDYHYIHDMKEQVHVSCWERHLTFCDHELMHSAFCGKVRFESKKIPNQYGGAWNTSWFEGTMLDYPAKFVFGRRKRVYSIEFKIQDCFDGEKCKMLADFFGNKEKVTMEFGVSRILVHAWGGDKVHEYVKLITETFFPRKN